MSTKKTTDQLVAERPSPEQLSEIKRTPLSLLLDNVRSLDNVGLLFRLCELARLEQLYLTGYTGHPQRDNDPREEGLIARHESRIFKTAVYAMSLQPWQYHEDPVQLARQLKEQGTSLVVLEQTDTSLPYHEALYQLPLTLIVGHERQGVHQELIDLADTIVEVPILGHGNSHNVAVATGIVLYHILEKTKQL